MTLIRPTLSQVISATRGPLADGGLPWDAAVGGSTPALAREWSPLDDPGLVAWYDPSDPEARTLDESSRFSSLTPKGYGGKEAATQDTESARPTLTTLGGVEALGLDGNRWLRCTWATSLAQPCMMIVVADITGSGATYVVVDNQATANHAVYFASGSWRVQAGSNILATADAVKNGIRAHALVANGAGGAYHLDDFTDAAVSGNIGTTGVTGRTIGGNIAATPSGRVVGAVGDHIITTSIDEATRARYAQWITKRYAGLTVAHVQPITKTALELEIQEALDNDSALNNVTVRLHRESDGREIEFTKGTPAKRYISSSTVKPITCAAINWGVHKGWFDLDDLIIDLVPEYEALATSNQRDVQIQHLMSFTSGLWQATNPSATSANWAAFVDNCAALATASADPDRVPGAAHIYATDQHALLSVAAVNASPYSTWTQYLTAFIADTGLFPRATWTDGANAIFGGNVQINITAREYANFLRAIFNETVLTPTLCQDLYTDATAANPARLISYQWMNSGGMTPEDWHFGRGMWLEQRNADWNGSEGSTRFSSIGVAGQYAYHDVVTGVTFVISASFPSDPDQFIQGLRFARDIDALVATWSGA